ncbi:diguanylate cyclase [Andreprevotia lacus DSM 23236]|jgi:diguanylate cyclase|uniref:diguanylate cyclase n=1 Tax=Andreprevotia lacus DSM 23236 TaxID=1121001 RepID=A0A1W1XHU4_9NEIS|nr:GGDEF domain-containing protein [Andreprevotia lacus]SMC23563.1 diguanylate cyclase [Andreprevotia lacus DSM 23236]
MRKLTKPTEIARETLKELTQQRLEPSPDHYAEVYHTIAGTPEEQRLPPVVLQIEQALGALPRQSPELKRTLDQLRKAARSGDWPAIPALIIKYIELQGGQAGLTQSWADLVRNLIKQWDLRNPAYSHSKKSETLERVLIHFGNDPEQLNDKLSGLIRSWGETSTESTVAEETGTTASQTAAGSGISFTSTQPLPAYSPASADSSWQQGLAQAMTLGLAPRLRHYPELADEASQIGSEALAATLDADVQKFNARLRKFWLKLELLNDQEQRLCDGLLNLLRLLTDNMSELVVEDDMLHGQIAVVQHIMSQPLDMRLIYDAEAGLKEVIYKQSMLKRSLLEAQDALKSMIASFIDRLGSLSDSTDQYQGRIAGYAEQLQQANDLGDIRHVMASLLQDTRSMQLDVQRNRDEMREARAKVDQAQEKIAQLENELREISEKIRVDQLTGALNRRGMEEAYDTETARALRSGKPLSLALLDIDNFKQLNDSRGHAAGDAALTHLVAVIKDLLRPTDVVARYGGEEFVLLLPETRIEEAVPTLQRLQRELTRRFFMHNNEKVLITFSAGVTEVEMGEHRAHVLERADAAMYRAKKGGKNLVVVAEPSDNAGPA